MKIEDVGDIEIVEPVEKENIVYDIVEKDDVPEEEIPSTETPPEENRYIDCDNCDAKIDCWNTNKNCLYKGDKDEPTEEIAVCDL